jgi:hypothetical protein
VPTREQAIDAPAVVAACGDEPQAACDCELGRADDHADLIRGVHPEDQHRDEAEAAQQECNDARVPANEQQQAATEFGDDHQRQQPCRHPVGGHVRGGAGVAGELGNAAGNEKRREGDAAKQCECVVDGVHGNLL